MNCLTAFWRNFSINHAVVFSLTFCSYAFLHATRKAFANVKPTLSAEWTPTFGNQSHIYPDSIWNQRHIFASKDSADLYLGVLDTLFMISYAVGLYISGILGDKFNLRIVLCTGMMMSAIIVFIFGFISEWLKFYNIYFYTTMWILNGLFQSTGWPCAVAIMSKWFGESRGMIFGIWSACASVGNIIGDFLVGNVVNYGYEYGFLVPASLLFSGGIIILISLPTHPEDLKTSNSLNGPLLVNERNDIQFEDYDPNEIKHMKTSNTISFFQALLLPGVILYSLAYACLKLVNYAFFFWLPFYLNNKFHWSNSKADKISVWYDVGGILGGIIAGIISDKMWSRSPITFIMLVLSIPSLVLFSQSSGLIWENSLYMGITGFFIGGPATIISSAISADLGSQDCLANNADALATVTGIVDGTGSIGAAVGQLIVPMIEQKFGWHWVFYSFIIMTSATIIFILPIFVKDILRKLEQRRIE